jgi:hypothetical protein
MSEKAVEIEEEIPYYDENGYSEEEGAAVARECFQVAVSDDGHVRLQIIIDDLANNPRQDCDPMGHMIFFDRKDLSDKDENCYNNLEEFLKGWALDIICDEKLVINEDDLYEMDLEDVADFVRYNLIWIPFDHYDNGSYGNALRLGDKYGSDDRANGVIYMTPAEVIHEQVDCSEESIKKCFDFMKGEVKELSSYFSGEVYGFVLEKDGEDIDSCWGFIGEDYYLDGIGESLPQEYAYLVDRLSYPGIQW